jgi:hypothetical protein
MARNDGNLLWVIPTKIALKSPPWGETQAAKVVNDKLEAPKANSFTKGEATTHQALSVGANSEC